MAIRNRPECIWMHQDDSEEITRIKAEKWKYICDSYDIKTVQKWGIDKPLLTVIKTIKTGRKHKGDKTDRMCKYHNHLDHCIMCRTYDNQIIIMASPHDNLDTEEMIDEMMVYGLQVEIVKPCIYTPDKEDTVTIVVSKRMSVDMSTSKNKYEVYKQTFVCYGDTGETHKTRQFVGTTYAVSEAKAVTNMAYRLNKETGFPLIGYDHADWYGDGGRDTYLVAQRAK